MEILPYNILAFFLNVINFQLVFAALPLKKNVLVFINFLVCTFIEGVSWTFSVNLLGLLNIADIRKIYFISIFKGNMFATCLTFLLVFNIRKQNSGWHNYTHNVHLSVCLSLKILQTAGPMGYVLKEQTTCVCVQ